MRRCIGIADAIVELAIFGSLMLAIAAAIRLTSPGPTLFTQERAVPQVRSAPQRAIDIAVSASGMAFMLPLPVADCCRHQERYPETCVLSCAREKEAKVRLLQVPDYGAERRFAEGFIAQPE